MKVQNDNNLDEIIEYLHARDQKKTFFQKILELISISFDDFTCGL